MKILIVDDMPSMRQVLKHMLHNLGYTFYDEATDGLQALNILRKKHYDLVITDLHMPKLNGQQLLKEIRSHKRLRHLPVLMVTCEHHRKKIEDIIACKVTGFIVKPFNEKILKKKLARISSPATENDIQII